MRYFRLAFVSMSTCAVALMLSGCSGNTSMNSDPTSGPAPAVAGFGEQVNGVAPNRALYVQFNEAMDGTTINSKTMTVTDANGAAMAGTVVYDTNFDVAEFQPDPALQENTSYTLTVSTGVKSAAGVALATAYTQSFTTRASTDKSPIYVKSVMPAPNATCISASTPISITFSEGAELSTLNSTNIVITGPGSTVIPAQMSYNVTTAVATLTPNSSLPSGAITVTVRNVADAAGVAMTSTYAWSFSTACTSGGGAPTVQYEAPFINSTGGTNSVKGEVSIDTMGNVTVQLTGAAASTSYSMEFCEAIAPFATTSAIDCVPMTNLTTDSSGNAKSTFPFPESGEWAGDFYLGTGNNNTTQYATSLDPGVNNETYMAALLPDTAVNGGVDTTASPQDPLASGSVSYSNGTLKFTVAGAAPNTTYGTNESETPTLDGSGTYATGNLVTDGSGNGSLTTTLGPVGGDIFQAVPTKDAGFIGGFSIPTD